MQDNEIVATLPDCREERFIDLLREYGAHPDEYDIHQVAAELIYLAIEQLAEERRMESMAR